MVADAVVGVGVVVLVLVHPVAVVGDLRPVGGQLAAQQATQAAPLHVARHRRAGQVEEGGREVDVGGDRGAHAAGRDLARPAGHEGHLEGLLVHEALVVPAVLAEEEALVRGVDDQRVLGQALGVQPVQQPAHALVDGSDGAQVALEVALVLEVRVVALAVEAKHLAGAAVDQAQAAQRGLVGRPGQLAHRHPGQQRLADLAAALGLHQAEVQIGQVVGDAHLGRGGGRGAVPVVVVEARGHLHVLGVVRVVLRVVLPGAVRRLVVAHQEEGARRIARVQPLQALVGDDVGDVARALHRATGLVEDGVEVVALPGHDRPVVEARRAVRRPLAQVPLADDGGLVAGRAQVLGDVGQAVVDAVVQRHDAVDVVVGAGQDGRAAGRADRVADVAVVQAHALGRDAVDVRRAVDAVAVAADRARGVVVGHDEQDVRALALLAHQGLRSAGRPAPGRANR